MVTKHQFFISATLLCVLLIILIASYLSQLVDRQNIFIQQWIQKRPTNHNAIRKTQPSTQTPDFLKDHISSDSQTDKQSLRTDVVHLDLYQDNITGLPPYLPKSSHSKELVVYTTHLYRTSNGSSYIIFLIGAGPSVYDGSKAVIGCGVNDNYGTSFKVRFVYEDIRQHRYRRALKKGLHRYQQLVVECYGIDVEKKDKAFLVYHNTFSNQSTKVYSNVSVVIPSPRKTPKEGTVSSVVCTKVLSKGVSWLPEFLRYQKTLGVDHVHIAILNTFTKDGGFPNFLANDKFFLEARRSNYVTVQVWEEKYDPQKEEWFYYGNILMYLDCIYRYRGTYDFISLFDTDDFFTIRFPGLTYKDFLVKYCLRKGIGSCNFQWLYYYPGVCGLRREVGPDGNVTASMVPHSPRYEQPHNYKPTHLSKAIVDSSFHDASCSGCLQEGYRAVLIPEHIAYVAHNRLNKRLPRRQVCRLYRFVRKH